MKKYKKIYSESNSQFFKTYDEVEDWLYFMRIPEDHYVINKDLTVDIKTHLFIQFKNLEFFPVQFGTIEGAFVCSNNNLITLKGSPRKVMRNFSCDFNRLKTLEYGPPYVGGDYICADNRLVTLKGAPKKLDLHFGSFICDNNKLPNLYGSPEECSFFGVSGNSYLKTLDGAPKNVTIFDCRKNKNLKWNKNQYIEFFSTKCKIKDKALTDLGTFRSK